MAQDTKIQDIPQLFTTKEVLDRLKISRTKFWELAKEKGIEPTRISGMPRYTAEDIAKLIDEAA